MRSFLVLSTFIILSGLSILLFQNCSEARLELRSESLHLTSPRLYGRLCAKPNSNHLFQVESIIMSNLTARLRGGSLQPDSDVDGLTDTEENVSGTFNPVVRRTVGKVLDSICVLKGGPSVCRTLNFVGCETSNKFGLSGCDIRALNLDALSSHPDHGLDSDRDGLFDLIEIINGVAPNRDDRDEDLDGDHSTNRFEINVGRNPSEVDGWTDAINLIHPRLEVMRTRSGCANQQWEFDLAKIPVVPVRSFIDSAPSSPQFNFSHTSGENIFFIGYKSVSVQVDPSTGQVPPAEIYGKLIRVPIHGGKSSEENSEIFVRDEDFNLIGKVLP